VFFSKRLNTTINQYKPNDEQNAIKSAEKILNEIKEMGDEIPVCQRVARLMESKLELNISKNVEEEERKEDRDDIALYFLMMIIIFGIQEELKNNIEKQRTLLNEMQSDLEAANKIVEVEKKIRSKLEVRVDSLQNSPVLRKTPSPFASPRRKKSRNGNKKQT